MSMPGLPRRRARSGAACRQETRVTDARAPAADDIRIYERQRAAGNVIKWDVCLVKGHFLRFLTGASVIKCW